MLGIFIVGNGNLIPIHGYKHSTLKHPHSQFTLKNVLHVPQIVKKNLVYVRKFFNDNHVSVEFDPQGFSMKELQTGVLLMRCDSHGELYPVTTRAAPHYAFSAFAPSLWHARLGHSGAPLFQFLRSNNDIQCNALDNKVLCPSCQSGKNVNLPFVSSTSYTVMSFDIIHADIWTSHVVSSMGHRYYLVMVDDFTNFTWSFPLAKKS